VSLRRTTGNEVLAKHSLELRPTRKRRREVLDPDEDEMDYPFADDLIGAPGNDPSDEAEKIPFLDLGALGPEEFLELVAEPETPVPPQEPAQIAPVDVTEETPFHEEAIEEIPPPPGLQLALDRNRQLRSSVPLMSQMWKWPRQRGWTQL
jgi:hypothetical protein